jgi:pimeloyl-ACP methyl ester carboxylesterase
VTETPDVVVLIPGFLGFARFGGFYYFADRLIAVLRGLLEGALQRSVPIVPVKTLPTDSLARRQTTLLANLCELRGKLTGAERLHLIGHSTGGVDAQLLGCTRDIAGRPWGPEAQQMRSKLRSVVTISAPHYGTLLADSELASWGEIPFRHPTAILAEARILYDALRIVPRDLAALAGSDLAVPNDVTQFLWGIARNRQLIHDLKPAVMENIRQRLVPDPAITLTCFVTGTAPRTPENATDPGPGKTRLSDPFFCDLYNLTQTGTNTSPDVLACERALKQHLSATDVVVRSEISVLPTLSPGLNDGIVNTIRQIVDPARPAQIGAFVVADHADVLGHYDRQDSLIDGKSYNAGLFHSGAGFGDDEFFRLYRLVARRILACVP